jgi:TELO2-interacting protein 1
VELEAGSSGSKALRGTALLCLRRLIEVVGDGSALAFFVPGIVTGLGKALIVAGRALAIGIQG